MSEKRQYAEEEIAHALALLRANGGNVQRTARQLGMPRETLNQWAGRPGVNPRGKKVTEEQVEGAVEKMAPRLDLLANRILDKAIEGIENVEVTKAGELRDLLVSLGVNIEKASFVRGGPTSRSEQVKVSLVDPEELRSASLKVIEGGRKADKATG